MDFSAALPRWLKEHNSHVPQLCCRCCAVTATRHGCLPSAGSSSRPGSHYPACVVPPLRAMTPAQTATAEVLASIQRSLQGQKRLRSRSSTDLPHDVCTQQLKGNKRSQRCRALPSPSLPAPAAGGPPPYTPPVGLASHVDLSSSAVVTNTAHSLPSFVAVAQGFSALSYF